MLQAIAHELEATVCGKQIEFDDGSTFNKYGEILKQPIIDCFIGEIHNHSFVVVSATINYLRAKKGVDGSVSIFQSDNKIVVRTVTDGGNSSTCVAKRYIDHLITLPK